MARAPLTFRQSDLERAIRGAKAVGLEISRLEIERDGKIVVIIGKSDAPHETSEIVL